MCMCVFRYVYYYSAGQDITLGGWVTMFTMKCDMKDWYNCSSVERAGCVSVDMETSSGGVQCIK